MAADNWTWCPICLKLAQANRQSLVAKARDSYGKVTLEEYEKLAGDAVTGPSDPKAKTLREDYEIGTGVDGRLVIIYSCSCLVCNFEFKFNAERDLLAKESQPLAA